MQEGSSKSSSGTLTDDFIEIAESDVVQWETDNFYGHLETAETVTFQSDTGDRVNLWKRLINQKANDVIKKNLEVFFPNPTTKLTSENKLTQVMITGVYLVITYIFGGLLSGTGLQFAIFNEPSGPMNSFVSRQDQID